MKKIYKGRVKEFQVILNNLKVGEIVTSHTSYNGCMGEGSETLNLFINGEKLPLLKIAFKSNYSDIENDSQFADEKTSAKFYTTLNKSIKDFNISPKKTNIKIEKIDYSAWDGQGNNGTRVEKFEITNGNFFYSLSDDTNGECHKEIKLDDNDIINLI